MRSDLEALASAVPKAQDNIGNSQERMTDQLGVLEGKLGALRDEHTALANSMPREPARSQDLGNLEADVADAMRRLTDSEASISSVRAELKDLGQQVREDMSSVRAELKDFGQQDQSQDKERALVAEVRDDVRQQREEFQRSLQETDTALRKAVATASADLEQKLERIQSGSSGVDHVELESQVEEALRRASRGEENVIVLRDELEEEQASLKELSKQVQQAVERVQASEAAVVTVREELIKKATAAIPPVSPIGAPSLYVGMTELEERVAELQLQVEEELENLTRHQSSLSGMRDMQPPRPESPAKSVHDAVRMGLGDMKRDLLESDQALERKVEQLRSDFNELEARTPKGGGTGGGGDGAELSSRVSEALQRMSRTEDSISSLRSELQSAMERVEASEAATAAVREELMCSSPAGPTSASLPGVGAGAETELLQEQVQELQTQASLELIALQEQQAELAKLGANVAGRAAAAGGEAPTEKAIAEFAQQVDRELQDLRDHQRQLGAVKAMVKDVQQQTLLSKSLSAREGPQAVEERVQELSRLVGSELLALTSQQQEQGQMKITVEGLAGQMKEVRSSIGRLDR